MKKDQIANLQANIKMNNFLNLIYGKIKELAHHSQDKTSFKGKSIWFNKKKIIKNHFMDSFKNLKFKFIKKQITSKCFKHLDQINFRQYRILLEKILIISHLKENFRFHNHTLALKEIQTMKKFPKKYMKLIPKQKRICLIIKLKMKRK